MKQQNRVLILMWLVAFWVSVGVTRALPRGTAGMAPKVVSPPSNQGRLLPVITPQVGTGPVCFPGDTQCQGH
jgi:hypothetical protein